MSKYITKNLFLSTLQCRTYGHLQQLQPAKPTSPADQLRINEGIEIQDRARLLFPEGVLVSGDNQTASRTTEQLLNDPTIDTIFEATFITAPYITKADILLRQTTGWKIIEIKSNVNINDELIDDLAYTTMVARKSGLDITSCSLLLVNKEYRLGMSDEELFVENDVTAEVFDRVGEFEKSYNCIARVLLNKKTPAPELKWECKSCEIFSECCGEGIENHIFELPRISHTKFCQLRDMGVLRIDEIPISFDLTETQGIVRRAVVSGEAVIEEESLWTAMGNIEFPAYYLDFETVMTAIPLYPDIAPYAQVPTQYSIHICDSPGNVIEHKEYLANPINDCRRELAQNLIRNCGIKGSIICYSPFEKTVIKGLIKLFPYLSEELNGLVERLFDLHSIIRKFLYHTDFQGSFSIKKVLPVIVPELSYEGMEIGNGLEAMAVFADMARGKYSKVESDVARKHLLEYCSLDTLAMVRLHTELLKHQANLWLLSFGWVPLLYADVDFPLKLKSECKEMNQAEAETYVNKMICKYHTSQVLNNKILKSWESRPCMSQRIHILKSALQAHMEGKYVLSVPSILPQIEGIVAENFGHQGHMGSKKYMMYLEQLLKNDSFENVGEVLLKFITDIILSNFKHGEPFCNLNRHAILHGADTSYDKESISLKVILVLDILTSNL